MRTRIETSVALLLPGDLFLSTKDFPMTLPTGTQLNWKMFLPPENS